MSIIFSQQTLCDKLLLMSKKVMSIYIGLKLKSITTYRKRFIVKMLWIQHYSYFF